MRRWLSLARAFYAARSDELDVPRVQHRDADVAFRRPFDIESKTSVREHNESIARLRCKEMQFRRIEGTRGVRSPADAQPRDKHQDLSRLFVYMHGHTAIRRTCRLEFHIDESDLRLGNDRQSSRLICTWVAEATEPRVRQPNDRLERVVEGVR